MTHLLAAGSRLAAHRDWHPDENRPGRRRYYSDEQSTRGRRWEEDDEGQHGERIRGMYGQPYGREIGPFGDEPGRSGRYEDERDERRRYEGRGYEGRDYEMRGYYEGRREGRGMLERAIEKVGRFFGKGPKGYRRSDERIKEEVCECLYRDPFVDASEIEIDVKNGEVTLRGTVDSRWTKRRAEEAIEDLSGVNDVHNQLRVVQETVAETRIAGDNGRRAQTSSTQTPGRST